MSTITQSTLNPNARIFIPKNPSNIILQPLTSSDISLLAQLDKTTQITLDALWNEYVHETIQAHYAEEIEDEIAAIRAAH